MKDNSDIPLPLDQVRSRVLVFAITDEATHEYEQITKGYVEVSTDSDGKNHTFHYLEVKDQTTNEVLMRSNLNLQNNFGKQKGSIISWTDEQQPQYQEIALSFEKDRDCDMFWRTICQKIGKSYLQINGMQKLQQPTVNNLNYILQKARNSIDLIDYNIVHSGGMVEGLGEVFGEMKRQGDEFGMGTVVRIVNAILSPGYSSNAIQKLLTGESFYLILEVQEFRKSIKFKSVYEQKVGKYLKNKFNLPKEIFQKIQLSHRAVFYRQNVLDLSEEGLLESVMLMICKEAQVEIMSYLNRVRFLQTLITYSQYPNPSFNLSKTDLHPQQPSHQLLNSLTDDKMHFLHQALTMYNQISSQQTKQAFKQNIYTSGVLTFIKQNIEKQNLKALEILYCISEMDRKRFFEFLVENFRVKSSDNMLKTLMKKYANEDMFRYGIITLIEGMVPLFNVKRELLDFFSGTFVCSVLAVAKESRAILLLLNILLAQLENSSILFPQLIKLKVCQKIASEYRSGTSLKTKCQQLQIVKFLKHIIIEQLHKGPSKNKQIQKIIIDSGFLQCCMMIYMKHSLKNNVISSSMLENLKLIEKMECGEFDGYIVREYGANEMLEKVVKPMKAKYVEWINKQAQKNSEREFVQVQRIVHEQILQNEQQDTYLMNEQQQQPTNNLPKDKQPSSISSSITSSPKDQNLTTSKQDSLLFLKRMMDQIKEQEQTIQRQPRKIVKRFEESKQTAIEFCFDLPEMDEVDTDGLKGT